MCKNEGELLKRDTIKKKGYGTVSNYCFLIKEEESHLGHTMKKVVIIIIKI